MLVSSQFFFLKIQGWLPGPQEEACGEKNKTEKDENHNGSNEVWLGSAAVLAWVGQCGAVYWRWHGSGKLFLSLQLCFSLFRRCDGFPFFLPAMFSDDIQYCVS